MLVRVVLGRQIKERQGWVDQAEPRRFLVSFDVESDSHAAAARECLTSVAAVPEIEPRDLTGAVHPVLARAVPRGHGRGDHPTPPGQHPPAMGDRGAWLPVQTMSSAPAWARAPPGSASGGAADPAAGPARCDLRPALVPVRAPPAPSRSGPCRAGRTSTRAAPPRPPAARRTRTSPGRSDQAALSLTSNHACCGAARTTASRVTSTVFSRIVPPAAVRHRRGPDCPGGTVQNVITGQLAPRKTMTGAGVRSGARTR